VRVDEPRDRAVPYDDAGAAEYHTDLLANSDGLLLTQPARARLLGDGAERVDLDLVDATVIPSGVALLTYDVRPK
jgi:hypothetical protein